MKTLLAAGLALALLAAATAAHGHVAEVTTSLSLEEVADSAALHDTLRSVVDDARKGTIAFEPTLIALTDARVIGERLYVRVLFADADGERTLDELSATTPDGRRPDPPIGPMDMTSAREPM
ncbi:MAG: hypothetical protein ACREM3_24540 [Candidatus Rokuibacteriota bacterium]